MKVLVSIVSPLAFWTIPERHVERLRERFPHIRFAHARSREDVLREIVDAEAAFVWEWRPPLLAAARRLRWIHSSAAGVGHMLFPEMVETDIVITNSRGISARPIAEHVIGVSLALFRGLHQAIDHQRAHRWGQHGLSSGDRPGRLLEGSRMGVIGLGSLGAEISRTAAAMGVRVSAIRQDPSKPTPEGVEEVWPFDRLPDLLAGSDIVVVAAPHTARTRGMLGRRELRMMKRDAILVNVSRGRLLREEELVDELTRGTIAGAALDVFEREPLDPASPLWDLPNVIITPHTAHVQPDHWDVTTDLFSDNLRRFERGEPLQNVVDKRAGY